MPDLRLDDGSGLLVWSSAAASLRLGCALSEFDATRELGFHRKTTPLLLLALLLLALLLMAVLLLTVLLLTAGTLVAPEVARGECMVLTGRTVSAVRGSGCRLLD